MYQLLTSLLFAGAFITALTVITAMFASRIGTRLQRRS